MSSFAKETSMNSSYSIVFMELTHLNVVDIGTALTESLLML